MPEPPPILLPFGRADMEKHADKLHQSRDKFHVLFYYQRSASFKITHF